jgi:hypothetical protein
MRVRKGVQIAWGQRIRGEPTGFDDIDSDDETQMSLVEMEKRESSKELNRRKRLSEEVLGSSRFVLVKEGEDWLGGDKGQPDITHEHGSLVHTVY